MKPKLTCHYLKIIILIELFMTLIAWAFITNLHPYWMQLLAFPYLPILDLITIAIWLVCRRIRGRPVQSTT
jgi:hypothetical protein